SQEAYILDSWFYEIDAFDTGFKQTIKVETVLYHKKSKYQDILVFNTEKYGKFLVLDGAIQFSETDEFIYQEMISFLPTNSHKSPTDVLVIGGGDGGVLRELDRHPLVKNVTLCEIDPDVIDVCTKFFPLMACGFKSPKAKIIIKDAFDYLSQTTCKYDVIIADLTDPFGTLIV
ncbi:hypothetical protein MXB_2201, partial [Myxobolus squamalis]